ncbi:chromatin modification- protein VID21, partial [Coemansia aciculifera]
MERIEELKEKGKWSFWQPRKHRAPPRGKAHWDYLLDEMAWMQADFAEERKLRVEMARLIASWVMDYHHAVDKSRYIVTARRYVLPDDFVCRDVSQQTEEVVAAIPADASGDTVCADLDKALYSSACTISRSSSSHQSVANQQLVEGLCGDGGSVYLDSNDLAAVPTSGHDRLGPVAKGGEDADVPIADDLAAKSSVKDAAAPSISAPGVESAPVDKKVDFLGAVGPTEGLAKSLSTTDKPPAKSGAAAALDDRVVPSESDAFASTLSIYQILAQIPQSEYIEDILGDSVYTLQSLNALMPYRPAWDTAYCDILDASPVVPICKTMWPDFGFDDTDGDNDSDSPFAAAGGLASTIDIHELLNLNGDDAFGRFAIDSDSHGSRSIFTRNLLAPPLLPMFTQANKTPRNAHSTAGQPLADTTLQQATSEACPGQAVFEWTAERDRLLAKVVQQYLGNWPLITETVNHALALYGSRALSARMCFEHWVSIKEDYSLDRN